MSNLSENDDEIKAKKWLKAQGYTSIERPCEDPPDYVVNDKIGVEVRRLNLNVVVNGQIKGEEQVWVPLRKAIEEALNEFGTPTGKQGWYVDCMYDPSKPMPKTKIVQREIHKHLLSLAQPSNTDLIEQCQLGYRSRDPNTGETLPSIHFHLSLPCGICLMLTPGSPKSAMFILQDVSAGQGILILSELLANIKHAVDEKTHKIKKREKDLDEWWLILVDHIGHIPYSGLTQTELSDLRTKIRVESPWSRVIIVSRIYPDFGYEL